jgi:hypothetical protein
MMGIPLELEVHEAAPPGWDDELRALGGVVFHSEVWASYKVNESDGEPLFCRWRERDGGEVAGLGLAIRKPPRGSLAGRLVSKVSFAAPPATMLDGVDFVAPVGNWARRSKAVVEVGLGAYDTVGSWGPGAMPNRKLRFEYPLPPGGIEDTVARIRPRVRRKARHASKLGLVCRHAKSSDELEAFADLHRLTEERLERNKGLTLGARIDRRRFGAALGLLVANGHGRLYGAYRAEVLEAATFFATFNDRAYQVFSAASDPGREAGGPVLALFEALSELRRDGCDHISLGGAGGNAPDPDSSEYGLHEFKTRFGAEARERASGSLLLRPLRRWAAENGMRVVRR